MRQLIELSSTDRLVLQETLEQQCLPMHSLPLRQQLWNINQGIVTDGHVYVDEWPNYRSVASIHTSRPFVEKRGVDFDLATFYQVDEDFDKPSFETFAKALAVERQWTSCRSVYANYVAMPLVDTLEEILEAYGKVKVYGSHCIYTALEDQNLDEYRRRLEDVTAQLPPELEVGVLKPEDTPKVIENWPYGPPNVVPPFFRWLLQTFPSVALRNRETGELQAWGTSYSCGALANLFITKEYRGRGLSEYLWLSIGLKLADFSPVQPYFVITPGNVASEKSSKKTFGLDYKTGNEHKLTWFFFYDKTQYPSAG